MPHLLYFLLLLQFDPFWGVAGVLFEPGSKLPIAFAAISPPSKDTSSLHIPPPPPISMPVWSLACPVQSSRDNIASETDTPPTLPTAGTSMNIVTFATPVSVAPPKIWAVSLYHGTLTKDSFLVNQRGILQLLRPHQKHLVPVLGKRSGREPKYSKRKECTLLGFSWCTAKDETNREKSDLVVDLLPDCALYVALELMSTVDAGDHLVAMCQVVGTGEWDASLKRVRFLDETPQGLTLDPSTALYTGQLRREGII